MTAAVKDLKVAKQYMPSLSHLAAVQVATPLCRHFSLSTLEISFNLMRKGIYFEYCVNRVEKKYERVQEILLLIPAHLRESVIETVCGMKSVASQWLHDQSQISYSIALWKQVLGDAPFEKNQNIWSTLFSTVNATLFLLPRSLRKTLMEAVKRAAEQWLRYQPHRQIPITQAKKVESLFHWRSDGTIDGTKTAQKLVLNDIIDIKERFALACKYCLEESIQTLWMEMKANGETGNLEIAGDPMMLFWVRRMIDASRDPWRQALQNFFKHPLTCHYGARYSAFLPSLKPEERKRFLPFTSFNLDNEDFLLCLHALTKKEEQKILEECPLQILFAYMHWPLHYLFRETLEKTWKYIDEKAFDSLLKQIFFIKSVRRDFNREVFFDVWNKAPIHWRQNAREDPFLSKEIDRIVMPFFSRQIARNNYEMRRKRNINFDERYN